MTYYTCIYSKHFSTLRLRASQLIKASSPEAAEAMFRRSKVMPVIRSVRPATAEEIQRYIETYEPAKPVTTFVALTEPDTRK